eukprot:3701566-Prorocentrum_lima.AAC.1
MHSPDDHWPHDARRVQARRQVAGGFWHGANLSCVGAHEQAPSHRADTAEAKMSNLAGRRRGRGGRRRKKEGERLPLPALPA